MDTALSAGGGGEAGRGVRHLGGLPPSGRPLQISQRSLLQFLGTTTTTTRSHISQCSSFPKRFIRLAAVAPKLAPSFGRVGACRSCSSAARPRTIDAWGDEHGLDWPATLREQAGIARPELDMDAPAGSSPPLPSSQAVSTNLQAHKTAMLGSLHDNTPVTKSVHEPANHAWSQPQ
ncbi:uncharacterized protein B0I36DRAFT_435027 [Microdochium trichocladiopsis]|uniref:Uncharacterized protein n=1 Tax=Microdochium trichocladiopsis TaxID=1682393 RepID=A0A9P9BNR4_9PEZI|nr:uncharacterized protein B0I36DRAFT_435027 [Microdochium trichocladiopsis]KAH7021133.1 hypothetical protein B0I36DRAFT_435027 [Microdochium trichocladiopsis]